MSAISAADTHVSDEAMASIIQKVKEAGLSDGGLVRRTSSVPALAKRSSTLDMGLTPEQAAIIDRMRAAQDSCGGFLDSSKKTMESSSKVLWDHFKKIPMEKLQSHIIMRFNSYDTDSSGSLDRNEMREAMAEMGRRPAETELDAMMQTADKNGDGTVNLDEFSLFIFSQIGVSDNQKAKAARKAENTKKLFGRSPSAPETFERVKSTESQKSDDVPFARVKSSAFNAMGSK
mmetsp:Transcript_34346/g.28966  ORF Transcript_34346/g.28966 Transcript_34346/m.28966 type:complete len:232 (-) Transcript_34346:709-1404(-)